MTIEQRQHDAQTWAEAYSDWVHAEEQAYKYDELRVHALTRLEACKARLASSASVGPNIRTRVFMLSPTNSRDRELVKVTFNNNVAAGAMIELLRTEPSE